MMGHSHDHSHPHTHDHGHSHSHAGTGRALIASLILTLGFVAFEAVAGFRASSLALLSDAGHNFADAFALLLAAFGFYLQSRPANAVKTFGYQRAGVLAAFVNAVSLVVLALFLFFESYERLRNPQPVVESTMIVVAAIGLAMNLFIVWRLGGHGHDMNIRAAWIHMMGDAMSCVAIIAGRHRDSLHRVAENRSDALDTDRPDDYLVGLGNYSGIAQCAARRIARRGSSWKKSPEECAAWME